MKNSFPLMSALAVFACGALFGLAVNSSSHAAVGFSLGQPLAEETKVHLAWVSRLRDGKTDEVISLMDARMDSDVAQLGNEMSNHPHVAPYPYNLSVIKAYRDYREKFPRTNSVLNVSEGIARAYRLLDAAPREGQ